MGDARGTKGIVKLLRANTGAQDMRAVFSDFCTASANAIRNRVDRCSFDDREAEYERIRERYSPQQMDRFAEALALVALELAENPRDVLGEVYMQLEIADKDRGQFFTPYHVAQLMAGLQISDAPALLQTRPFVTVYEPACGAGAMVIAMAQALTAQGVDIAEQLHVTADDLSLIPVQMSFIQFSLLGIPALVCRRNSLTLEHFDTWPTPAHVRGGWGARPRADAAAGVVTE